MSGEMFVVFKIVWADCVWKMGNFMQNRPHFFVHNKYTTFTIFESLLSGLSTCIFFTVTDIKDPYLISNLHVCICYRCAYLTRQIRLSV
jgi:hypothetical protein